MRRLTEAQRNLLNTLSDVSGKSGGFYLDLGFHASTMNALTRYGFAEATGHWIIRKQTWRITPAGRAKLAEERG